jgi:hypothetical protein
MMAHQPRLVAELTVRLQQLLADDRMRAQDLPLVIGQLAGLVQQIVPDPDLADVVHAGRDPQPLDVALVDAMHLGDPDGQLRHPARVVGRVRVTLVDRVGHRDHRFLGLMLEAMDHLEGDVGRDGRDH